MLLDSLDETAAGYDWWKQEGPMHVLWHSTNPSGIIETYYNISSHSLWSSRHLNTKEPHPLHLILDFTPKMSVQPSYIKLFHYQLKCHLPFPICLLPLTLRWKNHLQRAVLLCWQWFFCWYKSQLWYADSLHISLTFCMLRSSETTIESNGSERNVGTSRKLSTSLNPAQKVNPG